MPNRIVREGLIDSERVDQLSAHGERFYIRLLLKADDFGRFTGNVLLLQSALFPLKRDVRDADIPRWIAECEKAGLVRRYEVAGKPYLEVLDFRQRSRAEKSKYPAPPMFHVDQSDSGRAIDGQPPDKRPASAHVVGDVDEDVGERRAPAFLPEPDWKPDEETVRFRLKLAGRAETWTAANLQLFIANQRRKGVAQTQPELTEGFAMWMIREGTFKAGRGQDIPAQPASRKPSCCRCPAESTRRIEGADYCDDHKPAERVGLAEISKLAAQKKVAA